MILNVKAFLYLINLDDDGTIRHLKETQIKRISKHQPIRQIKSNLKRVLEYDDCCDPHTMTARSVKLRVKSIKVKWHHDKSPLIGFQVEMKIEASFLKATQRERDFVQKHRIKKERFSRKSAMDTIYERLDYTYGTWADWKDLDLSLTFYPIGTMWEEIAGITNYITIK